MVKICEKIKQAQEDGRPWWSFEFFPPKTEQGMANLYERIERMLRLGPLFVDITWGAGGTTSETTTQFVKAAHAELGLETCMHLTCTNMPRDMIDKALAEAKDSGCQNILALRGDPPRGSDEWVACEGGFVHAIDLVRHIRATYGDYFCICVAGFPEGHPQAGDRDMEMVYLKEKIDAGANAIITQMFYDVDTFVDWARRVRRAGITVPIIPGIMPIQTYASFKRRTNWFQTVVPKHLDDMLEAVKDDDEQVRSLGMKYVGQMCHRILNEPEIDISGLHIYTMNLNKGTEILLQEMGFEPSQDVVRPLPFRVSLTEKRRHEGTRPIFWSNRHRSYIARTADWDEFPNGRWGSAWSPAYNETELISMSLPRTADKAIPVWGVPTHLDHIKRLFARFCEPDSSPTAVKKLPWSDVALSPETEAIAAHLGRINDLGFLTINSQPQVDGALSSHPIYGWGPPHGYVYQKAYLEFFCPPDLLDAFLDLCNVIHHGYITYHAVNQRGDLRTNTSSSPNAVTWGAFPGQEIRQPTIVEAMSFLAWKDEAFDLGHAWADLYKTISPPTHSLINGIMDSYYLVNIVHNNYRSPDPYAIFAPFYQLAAEKGLRPSQLDIDIPKPAKASAETSPSFKPRKAPKADPAPLAI